LKRALVDGSEGGDSCGNSTQSKTQQVCALARVAAYGVPAESTAVADNNGIAKSVRLLTFFAMNRNESLTAPFFCSKKIEGNTS